MSLYKGPDGYYIAELRSKELGRLKLSMRSKNKADVAKPRYDALTRLWREAKGPAGAERRALLEQVRSGAVPIERLQSMVAANEPLVLAVAVPPAEPAPVEPKASIWPTVDAATKRYLDWLVANPNRRKSTWNAARSALRWFVAFTVPVDGTDTRLGALTLDAVTSDMIEAAQQSLITLETPPSTITAYMTRVQALWSWTQRRENRAAIEGKRDAIVLHSPIDPETAARDTTARDRWLTYDEAELLLAATPDQLLFVVGCGLFAGLRIEEALHLRPSDIDLTLGTLSIAVQQHWRPKTTRAERVVPIAEPFHPIVEQHLARFASAEWMMPALGDPDTPFKYHALRTRFEVVVGDAELLYGRDDARGVTFHTLRHTFASWLVMRGVDLYTVSQLLGDRFETVEDTYAHMSPDFKKRAIDALKGAVRVPAMSEETATETTTDEGE